MNELIDEFGDKVCENCQSWKEICHLRDYGPCSVMNIATKRKFHCDKFSKSDKFKRSNDAKGS